MQIIEPSPDALAKGFSLRVLLGDKIVIGRKVPDHGVSFEHLRRRLYNDQTWSAPSVFLAVPHPQVSSAHAVIEYREDTCTVQDVSTNGTSVNEGRADPAVRFPLRHGDRVKLPGDAGSEGSVIVDLSRPFHDEEPCNMATFEIDAELAAHLDYQLEIDRLMWANAGKRHFVCGTCCGDVFGGTRACRACLNSIGLDARETRRNAAIGYGLKTLESGIRWDRYFHDCVLPNGKKAFLELRLHHDRDLPPDVLRTADCMQLRYKHPGLFRLYAWFSIREEGWKYSFCHARVIEQVSAVNLASIHRQMHGMQWRSAVNIVVGALDAVMFALSKGFTPVADWFSIEQIWLLRGSKAATCSVKVDCHRQNLGISPDSPPGVWRPDFFSQAMLGSGKGLEKEPAASYDRIVRVGAVLYELITGTSLLYPLFGEGTEPFAQWCVEELPSHVSVPEPLKELILDCLAKDHRRAPSSVHEVELLLKEIARLHE